MSDRQNDYPKNKNKRPVNDPYSDEEISDVTENESDDEDKKEVKEPVEDVSATQNPESETLAASTSVETKLKKGKTLRFTLPEESRDTENSQDDESRSPVGFETTTTENVRGCPLPIPQIRQATDLVTMLECEITEDESLCQDTKSQTYQSANFAFKPLFDALKRSPTNCLADYRLLLSAHLRCLEGVMQSLESGANVNVTHDHLTPLLIATQHNDKPMVRYLVTIDGIDLEAQNIFGCVPLLIALKNDFDEIATLLLKNNAQLNVVDNMGRTPLHEALFHENYDMVKLLIRYGHELESPDRFGEKPIYTCSVKKPNLKLLNFLLNSGASCECESVTGLSLLSTAILQSTNMQVIKMLVVAGANVNHQDYFCKRTPLHMAATIDNVKIAKFLVEHGADPDSRTIAGYTAFDLALCYRCLDVAEYLAIYTKNAALSSETFGQSFLSKIPKHISTPFLLLANIHSASRSRRNLLADY